MIDAPVKEYSVQFTVHRDSAFKAYLGIESEVEQLRSTAMAQGDVSVKVKSGFLTVEGDPEDFETAGIPVHTFTVSGERWSINGVTILGVTPGVEEYKGLSFLPLHGPFSIFDRIFVTDPKEELKCSHCGKNHAKTTSILTQEGDEEVKIWSGKCANTMLRFWAEQAAYSPNPPAQVKYATWDLLSSKKLPTIDFDERYLENLIVSDDDETINHVGENKLRAGVFEHETALDPLLLLRLTAAHANLSRGGVLKTLAGAPLTKIFRRMEFYYAERITEENSDYSDLEALDDEQSSYNSPHFYTYIGRRLTDEAMYEDRAVYGLKVVKENSKILMEEENIRVYSGVDFYSMFGDLQSTTVSWKDPFGSLLTSLHGHLHNRPMNSKVTVGFVGSVDEWTSGKVTLTQTHDYTSKSSYNFGEKMRVYTGVLDDSFTVVWFAPLARYSYNPGDSLSFKGKVREHKEVDGKYSLTESTVFSHVTVKFLSSGGVGGEAVTSGVDFKELVELF